jgi:hypothetical protein
LANNVFLLDVVAAAGATAAMAVSATEAATATAGANWGVLNQYIFLTEFRFL